MRIALSANRSLLPLCGPAIEPVEVGDGRVARLESICPRQFYQRKLQVDDRVQPGPQKIGLARVSSLLRSHQPLAKALCDNRITN